ncbi:hypothetical protein [Paenibacillus brevis]|uniref:HEPN domain-containing protein n=1 Tax=Paenibacillus brevis TaxID=2841508 RepID=A0ABS6FTV6_9BACL|nr:hypothetical protein [Paenibacillus brevis]MBU5673657.1 hypothetical protein [Paenibacillus brevis]
METDFCYRIKNYRELAHYHMQLAYLMRNNHQFRTSLILCNLALTSIARALYVYENKSNPTSQDIIFDDFLLLIHKDLNVDPEVADLVNRIVFLCYSEDGFIIDQKTTDKLIQKTADILTMVSSKLTAPKLKKDR